MSDDAARARPDRVVIATSNPGKVREIAAILREHPLRLIALDELQPVSFPEEGSEYAANAIAKARAAALQLGELALADDSGLEVDALEGQLGPHSARYGGPALDDRGRVELLLRSLRGVPASHRGAEFVCVAALATPEGEVLSARGECRGEILEAARGTAGFGYDPIFRVAGHLQTLAELRPDEKNRISHRARALHALFEAWARS